MHPDHLTGDPVALEQILRDAERHDDHDGVLLACERLVAAAPRPPVRDVAQRVEERAGACRGAYEWVWSFDGRTGHFECTRCGWKGSKRAAGSADRGRPLVPQPPAVVHLDAVVMRTDHRLARLAANLWRLLAPSVPCGEFTARDVLAGYVGALRLWWRAGWFRWFADYATRESHSVFRAQPGGGAEMIMLDMRTTIQSDGRVQCGDRLPMPLPLVPAREEVDRG